MSQLVTLVTRQKGGGGGGCIFQYLCQVGGENLFRNIFFINKLLELLSGKFFNLMPGISQFFEIVEQFKKDLSGRTC